MPELSPALLAVVIAAGAAAGGLGSMLGLGGGVILVPFLNAALGFPLNIASGVGLMTVIATSSVVARGATGSGLVNLRLGMVLQIAAASGAYFGGTLARRIPEHVLELVFSAVTAGIAGIMLSRLERRNVLLDSTLSPGRFGGRYFDEESGGAIVYQTRRMPLALGVSLVAGSISGLLGIGGGILQVPALNAWCGVPLRAAAATSAVMIGITAAASAPLYYARGDIILPLAAAAVLGTFGGSRAGIWFGERARAKWLKVLMAGVLTFVSVTYLAGAL
ncbi:MAG: sulfite exporter TauE/SafE family protein [Acidobacteria bacterium]|nr:sulfite exporter TauE/SafE family protein [Acidobacteriota bacterium]